MKEKLPFIIIYFSCLHGENHEKFVNITKLLPISLLKLFAEKLVEKLALDMRYAQWDIGDGSGPSDGQTQEQSQNFEL